MFWLPILLQKYVYRFLHFYTNKDIPNFDSEVKMSTLFENLKKCYYIYTAILIICHCFLNSSVKNEHLEQTYTSKINHFKIVHRNIKNKLTYFLESVNYFEKN